MQVNVLVKNVIALDPMCIGLSKELFPHVLYTYSRTSKRAGVLWALIDQTNTWYPLEWFKTLDIIYN